MGRYTGDVSGLIMVRECVRSNSGIPRACRGVVDRCWAAEAPCVRPVLGTSPGALRLDRPSVVCIDCWTDVYP